MIELLKLCGFKEQEIKSEFPRVEKVFGRLGITAEDVEHGKQRLTEYYDMELVGVRKMFRLVMRMLIDIVLARDEGKTKIIYGLMFPGFEKIGSALVSNYREVYAAVPTEHFQIVLGCIFDKLVPVLEAAERKWLKAGGVTHCANVKTLVGLITLGFVPKPDLALSGGLLCETAPKTLNLLKALYNIPIGCHDTCLDRDSGEQKIPERISDLSAKSLRKVTERIQEVTGFGITDDMLRDVIYARRSLENSVLKLRNLIEESDPLPISMTHDSIWRCLVNNSLLRLEEIQEATDAINTLYDELQERVNKGLGVVEKGAPRILTFCPTHYTEPRIEHLMIQTGIAIVAISFNLLPPHGERRIFSQGEVKDPYEALAAGQQRTGFVQQLLGARISTLVGACKRLNLDGVLDRYHAACRVMAGDSILFADALRKELGLPVLLLEWEDFDPRVYEREQLKKRLEVFKAMMLTRRSG